MLWHIGKWGGRVDKDFNRVLKWVTVAFMCVIVTYPKVMAPKRRHPSPACLPHASFCLTDSLKLRLFACSQSHFHLWWSWPWAAILMHSFTATGQAQEGLVGCCKSAQQLYRSVRYDMMRHRSLKDTVQRNPSFHFNSHTHSYADDGAVLRHRPFSPTPAGKAGEVSGHNDGAGMELATHWLQSGLLSPASSTKSTDKWNCFCFSKIVFSSML